MSKFSKIKERLSCNKPTRSYKADKKKMVLACEDGKEKLGIGLVKIYGQVHLGKNDNHQKTDLRNNA